MKKARKTCAFVPRITPGEPASPAVLAEREELGSNLLRFAKCASASKPMAMSSKKGATSTCGHCDCRLHIPERERDAEQPVRTVCPCFRLRLQPHSWWGAM